MAGHHMSHGKRALQRRIADEAAKLMTEPGIGNALFLQLMHLVGAAPCQQRERRPHPEHLGQLFGAEIRRHESEDPDTPGSISQAIGRGLQQPPGLFTSHQSQGNERQRAGVGYLGGEFRSVADPRHGPLDNRVPRAVSARERTALAKDIAARDKSEIVHCLATEGTQDPIRGLISPGQVSGKGRILANHPRGIPVDCIQASHLIGKCRDIRTGLLEVS